MPAALRVRRAMAVIALCASSLVVQARDAAAQLIISEFRLRGASGASDEFIEIYNASGVGHTVAAVSGTGYGISASDGITRCTIPNGTVIPPGGHYLCINSAAYSLSSYPSGSGLTATGDAAYTTNIPDNAGIAIFNNNTGGGSYNIPNRMDAAGSTSEALSLYKEGAGYPALTAFSINYAWVRKKPGGCTGSNTGAFNGNCTTAALVTGMPGPASGEPQDTGDNAADFIFVDTNGVNAAGGQRLGAPGPENMGSPIHRTGGSGLAVLDSCVSQYSPPNTVRDFTSDPANNSTFGTVDLRRRFTNSSGGNITRLRFRVIDITTFPSAIGVADLRPRPSVATVVTVDRPPCSSGTSSVTVQGTTLEQPPTQGNGGGFNSTLSASTVTLATPLANGATIDVHFLFGIQQTGLVRVCLMTETLPATATQISCYIGSTETGAVIRRPRATDFNGDVYPDLAVFHPASGEWFINGGGSFQHGLPGDIPVPGDYNGDGISDAAVFRPSTGQWFLRNIGTIMWGVPGDIPAPGDYNGDGITDVAVYKRTTGEWLVRNVGTFDFGGSPFIPVPADYDHDGTDDIAVYEPGEANWFIQGILTVQFGLPGDRPVPGDYTGDGFDDVAVYRPTTGTWYVRNGATVQWGLPGDIPVPGDYDADGVVDIAIYRPATGQWFVRNQFTALFGGPNDIPLPRHPRIPNPSGKDMDGDARADLIVFRPSTSTWFMRFSKTGYATSSSVSWGLAGDAPVPGDYDGDGRGDPAVFRPSNGTWYFLRSSLNFGSSTQIQWGLSGDIPVTADFDADGTSDMAVFRPSTGFWFVKLSRNTFTTDTSRQWGLSGDVPRPGDYDGDGLADFAVFRPSNRTWYILQSSTNFTTFITKQWGLAGDVSTPADFDGDGRLDIAVYRPSNFTWYVLTSRSGFTAQLTQAWGAVSDTPMAADYDGDGTADYAVFRPSTGEWIVKLSNVYTPFLVVQWGLSSDTPLAINDWEDVIIR